MKEFEQALAKIDKNAAGQCAVQKGRAHAVCLDSADSLIFRMSRVPFESQGFPEFKNIF